MDPTLSTIVDAFSSLVEEFDFRVEEAAAQPPEFLVHFLNRTTGLVVEVDWTELRAFVWLVRLKDGKIPPVQAPSLGQPLCRVDADDILVYRAVPSHPAGRLLARADLEALAPLLRAYASAIGTGCADVLRGDFSVFGDVQPIVEARIRDFSA